ncbi:MAG: NAD(P)/FAD-dependent oxidoreductase [Verrucomicrobiaceae bacterium]|nr:MAG: NAD(P)/FAD-dependent oxidoreductase [Verrucomicrobiaceae bacterium]
MNPGTSAAELDLAVIGGGASGFFTALQFAELAPGKTVAIFEKGNHFLQKVRISGGGRCNVTHACFDPGELSKNYPRGSRELRSAFHRWQPNDTVEWFRRHGVELKAEPDGRMFPVTDRSDTVIDCFLEQARRQKVSLYQQYSLEGIVRREQGGFSLRFENRDAPVNARAVCIATGSLKGSSLLRHLAELDQTLQPLVPSLFAFNVSDVRISGLAGVSHPNVSIRREGPHTGRQGPLLITHRGFSGPAVLRLSAWEARELAETKHHFPFLIDWLPEMSTAAIQQICDENRRNHGARLVRNSPIPPLPRRLWERLVLCCGIDDGTTWGQLPKPALRSLVDALKASRFEAEGKTTNKDEFVTCGGIDRKTVDFRTMQSRNVPGLYFTGECVDIDGITGGFNFQAAWTTAHIAATDIASH